MLSKLTFILALAASVAAQSLSDIPNCALAPALTAIGSTGCSATDLACVCKDTSFLNDLSTSIQKVCSADDYTKAVTIAQALCLQNGVTIATPPATSAASAAASGSAAGSAAGSGSTPASTTGSVAAATGSSSPVSGTAAASTAASAATSAASAATSAATPVSSGSGSAATTKPASATSNGAAAQGTWAAAGLLGVGAILVAL